MAIHNVPADLADLFLETRRQWTYDMAPDYRAEKFMEWVEASPVEVEAWRIQQHELPASYYDEEYKRYVEQQLEEVPF